MGGVLIVDCYLDDVGGARNVLPRVGAAGVVRAAHEPVPASTPEGTRAVVVTGSAASVLDERPWAGRVEALVGDAVGRGVPVLGLCFGHQVLARALWGAEAVGRAERPELGWYEVERAGDDPLFRGVPEAFACFVSHGDEVRREALADDAVVLARTPDCAVHALRAAGRPAWGVQFHAEMGLDESEELVRARAGREGRDPDELLARRVPTEELAAALFANFLAASS